MQNKWGDYIYFTNENRVCVWSLCLREREERGGEREREKKREMKENTRAK